jgi:hypothetical protein
MEKVIKYNGDRKGSRMTAKNFIKSIVLIFGIVLAACSSIQNELVIFPTTTLNPTRIPTMVVNDVFDGLVVDSRIIVLSSGLYKDNWGGYFSVGEIKNISDQPLSSITMVIKAHDKIGNSLLTDDNGKTAAFNEIQPLLNILAPGEVSPYLFYFNNSVSVPFKSEVFVTSAKVLEITPVKLTVEKLLVVNSGEGTINISGEIVNQSDQWVQINGLAAAVIDNKNQILSSDQTGIYASTLAPSGDFNLSNRTPFIASIPDPGISFSDSKIYIDAIVIEEPRLEVNVINLTNHYFDQYGSFHLVGSLKNNSDRIMNVKLVAGLFVGDSVVLDADFTNLPYLAKPGDVIPFDISNFRNVNYKNDLAKKIKTYDVQSDSTTVQPLDIEVLELTAANILVNKESPGWNFQGSVTNTSNKNLMGEIIFAAIYDESGNISATGYTYIFSKEDLIIPGETNSFDFYIETDPKVNSSAYTYKIFVQAVIK